MVNLRIHPVCVPHSSNCKQCDILQCAESHAHVPGSQTAHVRVMAQPMPKPLCVTHTGELGHERMRRCVLCYHPGEKHASSVVVL